MAVKKYNINFKYDHCAITFADLGSGCGQPCKKYDDDVNEYR